MKIRAKLICILSILFISCNYGVDFKLQNNTDIIIDSLVVTNGFNKLKLFNMNPKEKKEGFLDFKENTPKLDGSYSIRIYMKDTIREEYFGYYSNGIPSESSFDISIFDDSITIKEYFIQ